MVRLIVTDGKLGVFEGHQAASLLFFRAGIIDDRITVISDDFSVLMVSAKLFKLTARVITRTKIAVLATHSTQKLELNLDSPDDYGLEEIKVINDV